MAENRVLQESEWFCSKHQAPVTLYCKDHIRAVCLTCALVDHKPCTLRDLGDVIQGNRETLLTLRDKLVNRERPDYRRNIRKCQINVDEHLKSVKAAVDVDFNEIIRMNLDSEKQDAAIINQEIDLRNEKLREDIRRINDEIEQNEEERERRYQEKQKLSGDTRSIIHNKQGEIIAAIQTIADEIEQSITAFERSWQKQTRAEEDATGLLDTTLEGNDETVVTETEQMEASVNDVLGRQLNNGTLERIWGFALNVKYIKSEGKDGFGRIVQAGFLEHVGEWKCVDSTKVTHQINQPTIVGYMDDGNVIITDSGQGNKDTYILNKATKHIQKVISTRDASYVVSCAMLNAGRVACGRYTDGPPSDSLTRCIIVYDTNHSDTSGSQWKELQSINIRIGTMRHQPANVYVAADHCADPAGRIIASEVGQKKIHVINPENGATINTIKGIDTMALRGMQSSGHIVAQASPAGRKLYIVEGEGNEEQITTQDVILNASVVPGTNAIYAVRSERECHTYVIWNLITDGEKPDDRVDVPLCDRLTDLGNSQKHIKTRKTHIVTSRVIFVTSTEMIASDGDSILLYRKS